MPDNNDKKNNDDAASADAEDAKALEQRVDKMMDPRLSDAANAPKPPEPPKTSKNKKEELPPLDIFKEVGTAPDLPKNMLKGSEAKAKSLAKSTNQESAEVEAEATQEAEALPADTNPAKSDESTAPPPQDEVQPQLSDEIDEDIPAPAPKDENADIDNPETDKAVDEIAEQESDEVLAVEDSKAEKTVEPPKKSNGKLQKIFKSKWFWLLLILAAIGAVLAVPTSRYKVLGMFLKQTYSVAVMDSKTNTPVSGATVTLDGKDATTDSYGKVSLKVSVGHQDLRVKKQYYKNYSSSVLVPIGKKGSSQIELDATGRQVPISIINKVTGQPLSGAEIKVLDTSAKTDSQGKATIVLPTTSPTQKATVSLSGYNTLKTSIKVTSKVASENKFSLVPAGKIYYLSNLSGNIDVVKANLDGSGRQTVVAGTGNEEGRNTVLLASRDWKYLALLSKRDGSSSKLYIINASTGNLKTIDSSAGDYSLVGWYGHDFVYDIAKSDVPAWKSGHELLASYNADSSKSNTLDTNQAAGKSSSYRYQSFYNFEVIGSKVVYVAQWHAIATSGLAPSLASVKTSIRAANPDGTGKQDYKSFTASDVSYVQTALAKPDLEYFSVDNYSNNSSAYYEIMNGVFQPAATATQQTFNKSYPTYLISPSSKKTFWVEQRDGKNTLLVGNQSGDNSKTAATLSDYSPYGWFSDNYLLVSKGDSELYIMAVNGKSSSKITDYYKPTNLTGYDGYSYGGV